MNLSLNRPPNAFSLLELLVVVAIVILLVTLLVPISETFRKRAEKVKCISHLRTLHSSLTSYVGDKGSWPQLPLDQGDDWNESDFYKFWITSLEPYGAAADTWLCPSDKLLLQFKQSDLKNKDRYFGTYVPTNFDVGAGTPFRWNQPWLLERGDFHGKGQHMLMPDGTVQDSQNPFYGR